MALWTARQVSDHEWLPTLKERNACQCFQTQQGDKSLAGAQLQNIARGSTLPNAKGATPNSPNFSKVLETLFQLSAAIERLEELEEGRSVLSIRSCMGFPKWFIDQHQKSQRSQQSVSMEWGVLDRDKTTWNPWKLNSSLQVCYTVPWKAGHTGKPGKHSYSHRERQINTDKHHFTSSGQLLLIARKWKELRISIVLSGTPGPCGSCYCLPPQMTVQSSSTTVYRTWLLTSGEGVRNTSRSITVGNFIARKVNHLQGRQQQE